jgi:prolyl-tRNA synthetase
MHWTKALIPTLKESPREAESLSHRLLLRAGFIRPLASGLYNYLPLGFRVLKKVERIVREEMDRIGAQELLLSALASKEVWEAAGRWSDYGDDMFRLRDRKSRDLCLCPTHEEIVALIAAREIRSYRDLPQIWYQIQTKFRDEPRPRSGLLRARQFLMKDSYSLDEDEAGLDRSYELHRQAYERIFERCGLKFFMVEASGGLMGQGKSAEFMADAETGEDRALVCDNCGYAANIQIARGIPKPIDYPDGPITSVATPDLKSVEEVAEFLNAEPSQLVKSLLYIWEEEGLIFLIRGDDELSEEKAFQRFSPPPRPATPDEGRSITQAQLGFIGPVGLKGVAIYADEALKGAKGRITGANRDDYHIMGLNLGRDVEVKGYLDLRQARAGDRCARCGKQLSERSVIELGHIFQLGTKYSQALGACYLTPDGRERPIVMGSYGVGLDRILATAIEQNHDDAGIKWPGSIAPFQVEVLPIVDNAEGLRLYEELRSQGIEVLFDDRDESPGVKFKDADLLGIPVRVVIGPRGLSQGRLDITLRQSGETIKVAVPAVRAKVLELLERI